MEYINRERVYEHIKWFKRNTEYYTLRDLLDYLQEAESGYRWDICYEPTDAEKNLLYCLSLRDDLTDKEVYILSRSYQKKVSIYNTIRNIANKNGIDILPMHPFIEEYGRVFKAIKYVKEYMGQDTESQLEGLDEFQKQVEEILF